MTPTSKILIPWQVIYPYSGRSGIELLWRNQKSDLCYFFRALVNPAIAETNFAASLLGQNKFTAPLTTRH